MFYNASMWWNKWMLVYQMHPHDQASANQMWTHIRRDWKHTVNIRLLWRSQLSKPLVFVFSRVMWLYSFTLRTLVLRAEVKGCSYCLLKVWCPSWAEDRVWQHSRRLRPGPSQRPERGTFLHPCDLGTGSLCQNCASWEVFRKKQKRLAHI